MVCPVCKSPNLRPARRRKLFDMFMRVVGQRPVRCRECHSRFYLSSLLIRQIKQRRDWARAARAKQKSSQASNRAN